MLREHEKYAAKNCSLPMLEAKGLEGAQPPSRSVGLTSRVLGSGKVWSLGLACGRVADL